MRRTYTIRTESENGVKLYFLEVDQNNGLRGLPLRELGLSAQSLENIVSQARSQGFELSLEHDTITTIPAERLYREKIIRPVSSEELSKFQRLMTK